MTARFKLGQKVITDFNGYNQNVEIIDILTEQFSQSRVTYKVKPDLLKRPQDNNYYDEGWFSSPK